MPAEAAPPHRRAPNRRCFASAPSCRRWGGALLQCATRGPARRSRSAAPPCTSRPTAAAPPRRGCWGRGLAPSGAVDLVEAGLEEEEVLGEAAELEE